MRSLKGEEVRTSATVARTITRIICALYVALHLSYTSAEDEGRNMVGNTEAILRLLQKSPSWAKQPAPTEQDLVEIIENLEAISKYPTKDIVNAVRIFEENMNASDMGYVERAAKIFLLNRYIFNVPQQVKKRETRFFGGWFGVPQNGDEIDMMWPLASTPDGKVKIVGEYRGYGGDAYMMTRECEHCNKKYGRRVDNDKKSPQEEKLKE